MKQSLANRFKKTLLLSLITFSGAVAQSTVVLDQNPPSVKWRQINTPSFKIIYPRDFEDEAQRMANTMEHLYYPVSKTMGVKVRKLPIILQNQNSISNGFVTVAPRRSEFYSMPPQDYNFLGSNDWLNLLAVHEYRHVVQYQRSETGWFIKAFKTVFGGDVWSFFTHVGVPNWFWEGDAVATETALTTSGRGRIPNFDLAFRTNLLENRRYNYHKQYLGSFKDFVPNYYVLGYHMVTHVRRNFDEEQWPNIFTRTFNNPYLPFHFSWSMKKETGYKLTTTYKRMITEVDSLWRWQVDNLPVTESSKAVFRENTTFTNYDYPQFLSDGKLVALRTGLSNIAQFVLIDSTTKAKKIHTLGQVNDAGMLSVGGDKIVWNEFRFNPRYSVKSYSVIKVYDYRKKSTRTLTRKSRLSGTAISPKGDKIVSIENAATGKNSIVILDANTGKELNRFNNQSNDFFAMPRWSDSGGHIVVLKTTKAGKTITQFSADGKTSKDLLPLSSENFGHPIQYGKYVVYNSPYSGIDNIYALDTESGAQYQITSKSYAAYNPAISADGKKLAFNNFTKLGMDVEVMPFEPSEWKPMENVEDRSVRYYEPLVEQEANAQVLNNIPEKKHESTKYSEFTHLFNPYSFYPILNAVDREFGGYINSQNLLGTMAAHLGASFNGNEGKPRAFAGISYQKFFPIIDIEAGVGARLVREEIDNTDEYSVNTWTENTIGIGTRIPLNLTTNKYLRGLTLGANGNYTIVSGREADRYSYYEPVFRLTKIGDNHS